MLKPQNLAIVTGLLILVFGLSQSLSAQSDPGPTPTPATSPTAEANASPSPQAADSSQTAELPPRSVLLICHFDSTGNFTSSQKQLLFESLATRLGASNPEILIRQFPDMELTADTDLNQIAINEGIDAWISVRIGGSMAKANFHFRAFDLQTMSDYFEMGMSAGIDSRFRNAFGGLWLDVEKKVASTIHKNRQINTVAFSGPANTIIDIDKSQTIGQDGTVGFDMPGPANYIWHAYLPGFHYLDGSLFLDSDKHVQLDFKPYGKFSFDLGLEWLSFPTIRVQFPILPDTLEYETGVVLYNIGIVPGSSSDGNSTIIKDYHLINILMGIRWYPLQHRYFLRPWFGTGLQIRLQNLPILSTDILNPGGLYLQFGTSVDIGSSFALFLEFMPRFTFTKSSELSISTLSANGGSNSGFNQMVPVGDNLIIEPWHFIFGLRIQP